MTRTEAAVLAAVITVAGAAGVFLSAPPLVAVLVVALLGGLISWSVWRLLQRRLRRSTIQARALADLPDAELPVAFGSLNEALARAATGLAGKLNQADKERERVLGILEVLPPPILLFAAGSLSYANRGAREMFRLDPSETIRGTTPMRALGLGPLADAVEVTAGQEIDQEVEFAREGGVYLARTSRTTQGEVALVLTDLTKARRVDAIRRDFVTNASHELKTPVAGIQALADSLALALARDPQRAARMIDRMQIEASRLATLVRELLDLARVEELTDSQNPERVDLSRIVDTQVQRARITAGRSNIAIGTSLCRPAWVLGTVQDARLVVDNLIQNAVRYNKPGGQVHVTTQSNAEQVVLMVSDTGIGVPEADRERIFERFYRVDKARSRAAGGTGLGLSLVRHSSGRMGGEVSVESVLGEGSTFTVRFPATPTDGGGDYPTKTV